MNRLKLSIILVLYLLPVVTCADSTVEIDGIYYTLIDKGEAAIVTQSPYKYRGNVVIPSTITYNEIEYSVSYIDDRAFYECQDLTSVTIPNSVKEIGESSFYECRGLESINIPKSVKAIKGGAFANCSGLQSVHTSDIESWCTITFKDIYSNPLLNAKHLFIGDEEIHELVIPGTITSIGNYTFTNCYGIINVTIPTSVTSIGQQAFGDCVGLTSLTIPNSVTSIGYNAFQCCENLKTIILPTNITIIPRGMLAGCIGLASITIPEKVTSISNGAFSGCGLLSVILPKSVTQIGSWAFAECNELSSVTIGENIKYINEYSFEDCKKIENVYCYATNVPNTSNKAFNNSLVEYITLHVPNNSINAYQDTEPWKYFKNIIAIDNDDPITPKCEKPTISYENGLLKFTSITEGVEFVADITDDDVNKHYESTILLTATYNISVYATKSGYNNSDVAMATLCWLDKEPTTEGITDGVAQIPSKAVLIRSESGILKVEGVDEGTQVSVYSHDGRQVGSAVCRNGAALIDNNIQPGNTAIVKIGEKAIKVIVR